MKIHSGAESLSDIASEVRDWYINDYGAHWHNAQAVKPEVIRTYYLDGFRVHLGNGELQIASNSAAYWQDFLDSDPGWIGSTIDHVNVVAISRKTAVIRAEWKSTYASGKTVRDCNSYVVARSSSGTWKFTNLEFVDCAQFEEVWD